MPCTQPYWLAGHRPLPTFGDSEPYGGCRWVCCHSQTGAGECRLFLSVNESSRPTSATQPDEGSTAACEVHRSFKR